MSEDSGVLSTMVDDEFMQAVATRLESSEHFGREAQWVDTAVVIRIGRRIHWLKIYKGRIIDIDRGRGFLGYALEIVADADSWLEVANLKRSRLEIGLQRGLLRVSGNQLEFLRLWTAIAALIDSVCEQIVESLRR